MKWFVLVLVLGYSLKGVAQTKDVRKKLIGKWELKKIEVVKDSAARFLCSQTIEFKPDGMAVRRTELPCEVKWYSIGPNFPKPCLGRIAHMKGAGKYKIMKKVGRIDVKKFTNSKKIHSCTGAFHQASYWASFPMHLITDSTMVSTGAGGVLHYVKVKGQ